MSDNGETASGGETRDDVGASSQIAMMQSATAAANFLLGAAGSSAKTLMERQREETAAYRIELEEITRKREENIVKPKPPKPTLQKLLPEDDL